MELYLKVVFLLGVVAFTTQDLRGRRGCDCSVCRGVDNKVDEGVVGKASGRPGEGKPGCSICEHRKEMLRREREKQERLQKCPFEVLGSPAIQGKTSQEVFDQFRELIVPSQNGFFDMMRGVVRTMHVSSEAELKWAKEKEAKELARRQAEEARKRAEEAQKKKEARIEELLKLPKHEPEPKVTVVVKQTPCGQVLPQTDFLRSKDVALFKRLPKEARGGEGVAAPEEEVLELQALGPDDPDAIDYLGLDSQENLVDGDFLRQSVDAAPRMTEPPGGSPAATAAADEGEQEEAATETSPPSDQEVEGVSDDPGTSTESPFFKFMTHGELRALSGGGGAEGDDFGAAFETLAADRGLGPLEGGGDANYLDPVFIE